MQVTVKFPDWGGPRRANSVREVTFEMVEELSHLEVCEKIFLSFGNHPTKTEFIWRAMNARSMSMGDFIGIDGTWYQCFSVGFKEVPEARVNEIMALDAYEFSKDESLWQ